MTNKDQIVKELIKDEYFHKWIIDPDKACLDFWAHWENEASGRKECIDKARTILLPFKFKTGSIPQVKKNMLWEHISDQIEKTSITKKERQKNTIRHLWYGIAAAVTLLMMVFFTYNSVWDGHTEISKSEISILEKVAPEGKISSLKFEDGTVVKLFSGSVIRYPVNFSKQYREVYLEGEGFFEVTKDANRPFIVKTNSLQTTALGTSFNIRTYENRNKCDVSLVTGKVKVEMLKKSRETLNEVILEPGEEAVLEQEGVRKQPFNIEEVISWKDGYIYLENKNIDETLSILERWFKVDFDVKNRYKANGKSGIGKFKNQSLENILHVIGNSFDFSFEINNDKVIINL